MLAEHATAAGSELPRQGGSTPAAQWPLVALFVALVVLTWSALPALLQPVAHADNVEQLNWAHALQWGYFKHPPLPTWLLHGAIALFGPSAYLTYALAMGCVGATLIMLWRCALLVLDRDAALLVLLLSSANYYLMGRGSFLNHNTVMLPFVAASAWAVLRILRDGAPGRRWPVWALLGLVQALGLLTKYQMAIIIAANALSLLALGAWRQPRFARHAAIACLLTALPLVPHLLWLARHEFSTFAYAGHSLLADLPLGERVGHSLGFVAQQLGRLAPAIIALLLALLSQRGGRARAASGDGLPERANKGPAEHAVAILALTPITLILALVLLAGVAPQNHWGASATLLLPLLAVTLLRAPRRPAPRPALAAVIAVHAAAIVWNVVVAARAPGFHHSFAAQPLAAMALAHWEANASGSPAIVIGPDWEAGAIALELPSHPAVLPNGDRSQAPWISDEQLARCGALVLWRPALAPEQQVGADFAQRLQAPIELQTRVPRGALSAIAAGIIRPAGGGCPP
ncbi:putative membrane protein [Burkholderiales bacterium]|nr:putative membrane protein [Burkholderiales bacterium]